VDQNLSSKLDMNFEQCPFLSQDNFDELFGSTSNVDNCIFK